MKNKDLNPSKLGSQYHQLTDAEIKEHCVSRNRLKRYKQGRMSIYTLLGKKRRSEV